jgi:hypothetical protein
MMKNVGPTLGNVSHIESLVLKRKFRSYLRDGTAGVRRHHGIEDYEALSYVWGSKTGDRLLYYEGKVVLTTQNCEEALRSLRRSSTARALWIDAICIDQTNLLERNAQVDLMGDVY